ncbi:hypothetical protein CALCODRAFT_220426 [Calocera cornea HHB12733]|uniref:PhoD-like phosphatase metallophosphatase domain-containing protein n=1 Tax=Calocera cornea HHB12733 TaxID=1353952 RepID=A0A165H9I2_9BASI|nr:hypothetical protein CALCODRAFT_220426 [Calocera cornea HHB12733]
MANSPPLPISVLVTVVSSLLRLAAYIFLELLPIRGFTIGIPVLFLTHLLLFTVGELTATDKPAPTVVEVTDTVTVVEIEEDVVKEGKDGELNGVEKKVEDVVLVEETATVIPDPVQLTDSLITLALTLPSRRLAFRLLALSINLLLTLFTLDYIYRPFVQTFPDLAYARVGAVTPHSAKLVLRFPLHAAEAIAAADELNREGETEEVERLMKQDSWEVSVWWRERMDTFGLGLEGEAVELSWNEGPRVDLVEANDWVGVVQLDKLLPATEYEYRFAFANSTILPVSRGPLTFRTFPKASSAHFKFVATSCLTPNFPYRPALSSNPTIKGFDLLAAVLAKEPKHSPLGSTPFPEAAAPEAAGSPDTPTETDPEPTEEPELAEEPTAEPTEVPQQDEAPQTPLLSTVSSVISAASEQLAEVTATGVPIPSLPPLPAMPTMPALNLENALSLIRSFLPKRKEEEGPESDANTEFAILLGDFIYADVPKYGGDDLEMYRRLYRRVYASDSYRKIYEHLPTFHIYDDHEIGPNYIGHSNDSAPPFPRANGAYEVYQNNANYDPLQPGGNYYTFEYADTAFFVLDCRRYRTDPEQEVGDKATMLGEQQLSDFYHWLAKVNTTHTFKFVVSSTPFNTLWYGIDGQIDTWAGYKTERHEVLQKMSSVPNVVVISGDRHEFAAVASSGRAGGSILEFSTSPLNQFYIPFVTSFDTSGASTSTWTREAERVVKNDEGEDVVEIVEEIVPEEKVLRYVREGQHKWGSFEVDTRDEQHPRLVFELFINGHRTWRLNMQGKPVKKTPPTTAIGMGRAIGANFKHAMEALGIWKALGL